MIITKEQIDKIEAKTPGDFVVQVYKEVYDNFDDIEKVLDFPRAGEQLHKYITKKAMDFDKEYAERTKQMIFLGGTWLNRGFSIDKSLKPWEVVPAEVKLKSQLC